MAASTRGERRILNPSLLLDWVPGMALAKRATPAEILGAVVATLLNTAARVVAARSSFAR
jgi:hypothetical protein